DVYWCHAVLRSARTVDFRLMNHHGEAVVMLTGVHFEAARRDAFLKRPDREWLYGVDWRLQVRADSPGVARTWVMLADRRGLAAKLAARFAADGQTCFVIHNDDGHPKLAREFEHVLSQLIAKDSGPLGFIDLRSVDDAATEIDGCAGLLRLA